MGYNRGHDIPQWLEPWIGGGLLLVSLAFFVFAARYAIARKRTPKIRWGNAIGLTGAGIFFSGLGIASLFSIDFFPGLFAMSVTGFVAAGVGGTMAGWQRSGRL